MIDKIKKKHFEERICDVCSKPFFVRKKSGRGSANFLRSRVAKTCSKECSRRRERKRRERERGENEKKREDKKIKEKGKEKRKI